jgi:hypothetical protein
MVPSLNVGLDVYVSAFGLPAWCGVAGAEGGKYGSRIARIETEVRDLEGNAGSGVDGYRRRLGDFGQ